MPVRPRILLFAILIAAFASASCDRRPDAAAAGDAAPASEAAPPPSPAPDTRTPGQKKLQQDLGHLFSDMAARQAHGLGNGIVAVNGAWIYDGYSHLSPNPDAPIPARLVAVDITVKGHTADFDLDDIEIVDGATLVSYDSNPHFTLLNQDGQPAAPGTPLPPAPEPLRALLIYAFPVGSPTFKLVYWGRDLTPKPHTFADSGWGLPYPAGESGKR